MQSFHIIKESKFDLSSYRNNYINNNYDLNIDNIKEEFKGSIDLENNWNIGVIVGNSGTGKTTISKQLFPNEYIYKPNFDNTKSIIDCMPNKPIDEITKTFNLVGFSTVWSWLKPYNVLSEGEKMRVDLAYSLLLDNESIVFDEFTSVVNRDVAKISSYAISKAIKKTNKKIILVACHFDILEWLEPDWIFNTNNMEYNYTRGLLRRPDIKIDIQITDKDSWQYFKKYHYLNSSLQQQSKCFIGLYNNIPICFFAVLYQMSKDKNITRGHRLVVLPDYQGVGLGHKFCNEIAQIYINHGWRFRIKSRTKALYYQRIKDKNWIVQTDNNITIKRKFYKKNLDKFKKSGNHNILKEFINMEKNRSSKPSYVYEYIGKKEKINEYFLPKPKI